MDIFELRSSPVTFLVLSWGDGLLTSRQSCRHNQSLNNVIFFYLYMA